MDINKLSLEEKVGQLFIVGRKAEDIEGLDELIEKYKVGGLIIYRRNYKDYQDMINLINKFKKINSKNKVPIFISIDQEGGRVNRIPSDVLNVPAATKIANSKDIELVKESGRIIGEMLRKSGISMNYGPILDIRRFKEEHPIGDRCYGETKEDVNKYAIEVMKEMQNENILPVVKHFPGHGLTKKDSHFMIPIINESKNEVETNDMIPFEEAVKNGTDGIMVGHLIIKDIDKYPASISKKIIQEYLVGKYNYKGLIITDDFKMWAIRIHYNMKKAILRAIEAGNDMIMLGFSYKYTEKLINYIVKQVKKGKISEERINQSVEKILRMKEKYNLADVEVKGFDIEEMNKRIKIIRDKVME